MTPIPSLFALWATISLAVDSSSSSTFSDLCQVFGVSCSIPLTLAMNNEAGVRGVFVSNDIPPGTTVLQIPLHVCLRDDEGPLSNSADVEWSTRLAANVLELQAKKEGRLLPDESESEGEHKYRHQQEMWLALLPNADELRESLPIHWDDDVLNSIASPSLQSAVDASYFARAGAVTELQDCAIMGRADVRSCHDALDVVQTRSCRVTNGNSGGDLRLLAPLFDMLNHGGTVGANAQFMRYKNDLIVQTTQVVSAGSELLIDYGASARPAWKCLQSYGFVPFEDVSVEPLVVNGVRYDEVGMESIPYALVEDVSTNLLDEPEVALTPQVCTYIADCAEQATKDVPSVEEEESGSGVGSSAKRLVSKLNQSRVRTLTAFARGLRDYHND